MPLRRRYFYGLITIGLLSAILFSACGGVSTESSGQATQDALYTQAAETIAADLSRPSATPRVGTSVLIPPSGGNIPATFTPTPTRTSTPTRTPTPRPTNTPLPSDTPTASPTATFLPATSIPLTPTVIVVTTAVTPSPVAGPSATLAITPLPGNPQVTARTGTNCRLGPADSYPIVGYLFQDQSSPALGRDPSSQWWYILNPDSSPATCWVWSGSTDLSGDPSLLPEMTPSATLTPTSTSTITPTP